MRLFVVVAALLSFVLSTAARGQERMALVVANSSYAGAPTLANAGSSADAVATSLQQAGFRVSLVTDANRNDLALALVDFSLALGQDGDRIGLIYYVGYAAQFEGSNYLLPADAVIVAPEDIAAAGVPLNGVLNLLGAVGAAKVVILDAAWDEGLARAGVERGLAPIEAPAGTIVTLSTQPGMTAADGGGAMSAYADAFASALDEPGLDVHLVLARARDRVIALTGGGQRPWEASSLFSSALVLNETGMPKGEAPAGPLVPGGPAMGAPEPPAEEQIAAVPPPPLDGSSELSGSPPIFSLPSGGGGGGYDDQVPMDVPGYDGSDSTVGSAGGLSEAEVAEMQRRYDEQMEEFARQRREEAMRAEEQARMEAAEREAEAAQAQNNLGQAYESPPTDEARPPPPAASAPRPPIVPGGGDGEVADIAPGSGGFNPGVLYVHPAPLPSLPEPVPVMPPDSAAGGTDGALGAVGAESEEPLPPIAARPPSGEIRPGGGDGAAPGSGGNFHNMLAAYPEHDAWAIVSSADHPAAYLAFLETFPDGLHFADAARRYAELTGAPAAAADPPTEAAVPPAAEQPTDEEEVATEKPAPPPAETTLARHPTLDAPDSVIAEQVFTVSVALTEEQLTPDVTARAAPTTTLTTEGALEFSLPSATEEWPIDIDLLAAGFDLADGGKWSRRVTLYRAGDSDFARFELKARRILDPSKPRQLMARFYHAGRFLGSVSRPVAVMRDAAPPPELADPPAEAAAAPPAAFMSLAALPPLEAMASELVIGEAAEVPDLDVTIHYDDPDNLGAGLIVLHSPHIAGPVSAEFTTPAGMGAWLDTEYVRLVQLGLRLRGAVPLAEPSAADPAADRRFVAKVAEGFGDDLYRNYVPQAFKDVFWSLKLRGLVHSIQITSNSPVLPWELVRPRMAEGAQADGFLGISYRLARWAPRAAASQLDQPLNRMPFTGVATVAPSYENNQELPFQQVEIDALSKLDGFRLIGGDFSAFAQMVGEVSTGFIHFSGHGEVNDLGTGSPVFAIRLADQLLDPSTWRALTFAPRDKGNPFYFFNACDTGRAASLGGFVQGWGPAVLASGASGFIGGMWPLTDRTAASFSTEFYGGLTGHLADGPVYLAEVLQGVRRRFYETGDPTYLAYTFYGNANLKVVAE